MYKSPQWGTVNLGVDVLQGHGEQSQPGIIQYHQQHPNTENKQQYNPGRNQELNIPPDQFRMQKNTEWNPYSPDSKITRFSVHERIKELLGEGVPKREAVAKAKQEAEQHNVGDNAITKAQVYRYKYAAQPDKEATPFQTQEQEQPFM